VGEGAASVGGVIEARGVGVIVNVIVPVVIQEDDGAVDVDVVVAVVQGVQPRQDGQRGAERSQNQRGGGPAAAHLRIISGGDTSTPHRGGRIAAA
jgi:hypothetical protein